ncbi:MAG: GreA/GreB family elongation factor [Chloroflexota bacterium]
MVAKSKQNGATGESAEALTIGEALRDYVSTLSEADRQNSSAELGKFARWVGNERKVDTLAPPEIGDYSDHVGARGTAPDAVNRLGVVKQFLSYLKKRGHINSNLAQHLRLRRGRSSSSNGAAAHTNSDSGSRLTRSGYEDLQRQLAEHREHLVNISQDIKKAAADKDVRENAPLDAAREAHGMVSAKITELEGKLRGAVIMPDNGADGEARRDVVRLGAKVTLKDQETGRNTQYQLVHPDEANPLSGKISSSSPVGEAIIGRVVGEEVEVETPRGTQTYEIVKAG